MTYPTAPKNTSLRPRPAREVPLNPLRYHAMVNPARIPEPAPLRRSRRRWPAIAWLGIIAALLAVAIATAPTLVALLTN